MRRVKVRVTKADIRAGKQCNATECPLALAMHRALGERAVVGLCEWNRFMRDETFLLPDAACEFRRNFDNAEPGVKPFAFIVEIPV